MLRCIALHLIILGCYLRVMGAMCNPTPPAVDDIIHRAPPPPDIICEEGFQGLHGFIGRDDAKKNCYTALRLLKSGLVRPKRGSFHAVRNRETGKPLILHKAVDNSSFLKVNSAFNFAGQARNCLILVKRDRDQDNPGAVFPTARLDTTVYFYFWEHALDIARQIFEQCFDDASEHRAGQQENIRIIGSGQSRIEANDWFFPYTVTIAYHRSALRGELRDRPASQSLQLDQQASCLDSQVSRPRGRLSQICRSISNSLLCANQMPRPSD
jgi:hypothetical protein